MGTSETNVPAVIAWALAACGAFHYWNAPGNYMDKEALSGHVSRAVGYPSRCNTLDLPSDRHVSFCRAILSTSVRSYMDRDSSVISPVVTEFNLWDAWSPTNGIFYEQNPKAERNLESFVAKIDDGLTADFVVRELQQRIDAEEAYYASKTLAFSSFDTLKNSILALNTTDGRNPFMGAEVRIDFDSYLRPVFVNGEKSESLTASFTITFQQPGSEAQKVTFDATTGHVYGKTGHTIGRIDLSAYFLRSLSGTFEGETMGRVGQVNTDNLEVAAVQAVLNSLNNLPAAEKDNLVRVVSVYKGQKMPNTYFAGSPPHISY